MGKLFLFFILWRLTGNPFLAILVILVVYYFIDRRFIGLLPNFMVPLRRQMRISFLRKQLAHNPHDSPAKLELAQCYIERKQFRQARHWLEQLPESMHELPDVLYDKGLCALHLGLLDSGEQLVLQALSRDGRLRYGEPYLRLAAALASVMPDRALDYLRKYQAINYSSCESLYRMGQLLKRLGERSEANTAWAECVQTYRSLPKFRKRTERRWAILALFSKKL